MGSRSLMVFRIDDRRCGLPLEAIREVLHMAALGRPPGLPRLLEGFLDVGGTMVPIVHTTRLFGLHDTEAGLYTPVLLLKADERPVGLMVDEVDGIVSVAEGAMLPVRDRQAFNGCVTAEVLAGGETVHLLSAELLLLEEERQRLDALRSSEESRLSELRGAAA